MMNVERMIDEVGEAVDYAVLDPTKWQHVLDTIPRIVHGTKALLMVDDTRANRAVGQLYCGLDDKLMSAYQQHYAKVNPWLPFIAGASTLQALIADDSMPSSSFRNTEFYNGWIVPEGEVESAVGIKLMPESDRMGVLAVHFGSRQADKYNPLLAHIIQKNATRLRRAVDAARLAVNRGAAPRSAVPLGAFQLPAFVLDQRGKLLEFNKAASELIDGSSFRLGIDNSLRFADASMTERVAAVARQVAAGCGRWSQGTDCVFATADGRRFDLSLFAVRGAELVLAGVPPFVPPPRLTLLLVRTNCPAEWTTTARLMTEFGLTMAERRLIAQLLAGLSLQQSAQRLGVAYETARSQLKSVFAKTGTHRQGELVALISLLLSDIGKN